MEIKSIDSGFKMSMFKSQSSLYEGGDLGQISLSLLPCQKNKDSNIPLLAIFCVLHKILDWPKSSFSFFHMMALVVLSCL